MTIITSPQREVNKILINMKNNVELKNQETQISTEIINISETVIKENSSYVHTSISDNNTTIDKSNTFNKKLKANKKLENKKNKIMKENQKIKNTNKEKIQKKTNKQENEKQRSLSFKKSLENNSFFNNRKYSVIVNKTELKTMDSANNIDSLSFQKEKNEKKMKKKKVKKIEKNEKNEKKKKNEKIEKKENNEINGKIEKNGKNEKNEKKKKNENIEKIEKIRNNKINKNLENNENNENNENYIENVYIDKPNKIKKNQERFKSISKSNNNNMNLNKKRNSCFDYKNGSVNIPYYLEGNYNENNQFLTYMPDLKYENIKENINENFNENVLKNVNKNVNKIVSNNVSKNLQKNVKKEKKEKNNNFSNKNEFEINETLRTSNEFGTCFEKNICNNLTKKNTQKEKIEIRNKEKFDEYYSNDSPKIEKIWYKNPANLIENQIFSHNNIENNKFSFQNSFSTPEENDIQEECSIVDNSNNKKEIEYIFQKNLKTEKNEEKLNFEENTSFSFKNRNKKSIIKEISFCEKFISSGKKYPKTVSSDNFQIIKSSKTNIKKNIFNEKLQKEEEDENVMFDAQDYIKNSQDEKNIRNSFFNLKTCQIDNYNNTNNNSLLDKDNNSSIYLVNNSRNYLYDVSRRGTTDINPITTVDSGPEKYEKFNLQSNRNNLSFCQNSFEEEEENRKNDRNDGDEPIVINENYCLVDNFFNKKKEKPNNLINLIKTTETSLQKLPKQTKKNKLSLAENDVSKDKQDNSICQKQKIYFSNLNNILTQKSKKKRNSELFTDNKKEKEIIEKSLENNSNIKFQLFEKATNLKKNTKKNVRRNSQKY